VGLSVDISHRSMKTASAVSALMALTTRSFSTAIQQHKAKPTVTRVRLLVVDEARADIGRDPGRERHTRAPALQSEEASSARTGFGKLVVAQGVRRRPRLRHEPM